MICNQLQRKSFSLNIPNKICRHTYIIIYTVVEVFCTFSATWLQIADFQCVWLKQRRKIRCCVCCNRLIISSYEFLPQKNEHKYNIDSSFENENNMSCSFENYNDEDNIDVDNMTYEELLELENKIGYVKTGVSIEQKLSLKIEQYSPNKIDCKECVICKELFKENEFIRLLNCSHVFHINCIDEWFKDNKICPICKKEVE